MLWAAWADALGFISELTNEAGLRRRLRGQPLTEPVQWTRRVGGKFGVDMTLPAGCYSDDTQLRLATARAVHGRGFDVEAFARIELAMWPAYALGGGRASKAAAAQMAKPGTPWFGNFHEGWLTAGGNGVAMRIQPHVWAAPYPAVLGQHVLDVIVNGATSHGHPRALVGAVLHALSLGATLQDGQVPSPERWPDLLDLTEQAVKLIDDHPQLGTLWRPTWETQADTSFAGAWQETVEECRQILPTAIQTVTQLVGPEGHLASDPDEKYDNLVNALELRNPEKRGNATTTVITALALAAAAPADPIAVSQLAARFLGTDTDTIATMAAALLGASDNAPEPLPVLDAPYLTAEAVRLAEIASGQATTPFSYPDLLHWVPPRTQLDSVGLAGSFPALAGLGWLELDEEAESAEARGTRWVWMRSDFGAAFLVKLRSRLRELPQAQWPARRERLVEPLVRHAGQKIPPDQPTLYEDVDMTQPHADTGATHRAPVRDARDSSREPMANHDQVNIDQMLDWVARRGFSDKDIGYAVKRISQRGTAEQLISFTSHLRVAIGRSSR